MESHRSDCRGNFCISPHPLGSTRKRLLASDALSTIPALGPGMAMRGVIALRVGKLWLLGIPLGARRHAPKVHLYLWCGTVDTVPGAGASAVGVGSDDAVKTTDGPSSAINSVMYNFL